MSTSHTPGPWTAKKDIRHSANTGVITNGPLWWAIYSPNTRIACMEEAASWRPEAEQQANAALIAAAPELLAALEELVDVCPCRNGCKKNDMTCATNKARAAIAKAKGQ